MLRLLNRRLRALAVLGVAACGKKHDNRPALVADDTTTPAAATIVQAPPAGGSFAGEEGADLRADGRDEATRRADGTAEWSFELDSLDLRRKVTIRIALRSPESTTIVLRAIDAALPAPGMYGVMLPSTGASHHDPRMFRGDIHTTEAGSRRNYLLGSLNMDTVVIETPVDGGADSTIRGRIKFRGSRSADAKPGESTRDYVKHDVFGTFVAPQSMSAGPSVAVTPAMQEAVLRRALDGFVMTHMGAANADGAADSTKTTALARRFLESRWGGGAAVDSVMASGQAFHVRLRGRFVPTTCEVDSSNSQIVCR